MGKAKRPKWIDKVAKKVHTWRDDPAKLDRFLEQIRAYYAESNKAQKKWQDDRKSYFSKISEESPLRDPSQCPQDLDSCSKRKSCSKDPARCTDNKNFRLDYCGDITVNKESDILIPSEVWIPVELCPENEPDRKRLLPLGDEELSLKGKYLILFLLHDVVHPKSKIDDPSANPYGLPEPKNPFAYAIELKYLKDYPPNEDKTRIESFLIDAEKDLQKTPRKKSDDAKRPLRSKNKGGRTPLSQKEIDIRCELWEDWLACREGRTFASKQDYLDNYNEEHDTKYDAAFLDKAGRTYRRERGT